MCGIAGAFHYKTNRSVSREMIKSMNSQIIHRGPDDEGFYFKDSIALAFRRLSIIDLHTGNQPIHNEDHTLWVIFNGEIYNYVELREDLIKQGHIFYTRSDTEVIVHLYEEYGLDFPLHLNGMYAIALWNEITGTLYLVRDRAGIKPLYYADTSDGIVFGSEIKAVLKAGVSKDPDYEALNQYLSYGYIPSPLTGFRAIRKVNAGHMIVCSKEKFSEHAFWDLQPSDNLYIHLGEEQIIDILIDELKNVLDRQTRSDVPIGIFLSGGIDSALVASVAVEKCNLKLNAFTVGFNEKSYNELDKTKVVAERLGLSLQEFILSENVIVSEIDNIMSFIDEPLFDYSAIPVYFLSKMARPHVKTVVGGEGGDELFGGYQTHYLYKISNLYKKMPRSLRSALFKSSNKLPESHNYMSMSYKIKRFLYGAEFPYDEGHYRWKVLFDEQEKKKLLSRDFIDRINSLDSFNAIERYFSSARAKGYSILDQLMYVDFKTFLQDDPLQKTDRMSMANSLEVRVPLLDNSIIDFSQYLEQGMKIKGFKTKHILRRALSRFQPNEIAFGKKRGFTPPLALWIKNGLREYMLSTLSPSSLSNTEFLDHRYIHSIVSDHLEGRAENSRLIWSLVVLVNWYKNYVLE